MNIYTAQIEDLPGILSISSKLEYERWNESQLTSSLQDKYTYILVEKDDVYRGFCIFTVVADEAVLVLLGVNKVSRQKGIGQALFLNMTDIARRAGAKQLFLEVRSKNFPAIALYEKLGCENIGIRKGFYNDPVDDAVNYRMDLENA